MILISHGIDIIDLQRIAGLVARDDEFVSGWFTLQEIDDIKRRNSRIEVIGGRIAAKEATAKALGTGFAGDVSWQDIEIRTLESGAPKITVSGGALRVAKILGIEDFLVSISHTTTTAMASVIAIGSGTGGQTMPK